MLAGVLAGGVVLAIVSLGKALLVKFQKQE
jgi:hypothetical protein